MLEKASEYSKFYIESHPELKEQIEYGLNNGLVFNFGNDEFEKLKNYDIDVIFAGHSLGGQLRLPFWGATLKKDGASIYTNDYYNENNTKLYVSYGIGTNPPHIRTFNKPSINVYRLKKI